MSRATVFISAAWIGIGAVVIGLADLLLPLPEVVAQLAGVIAILCCWILVSTRNADEYTQGLWTSGASLAFTALLVMIIVWPFLEGVYAGFHGVEDGEPTLVNVIAFAIIAFYVGLFWKRVRGGI